MNQLLEIREWQHQVYQNIRIQGENAAKGACNRQDESTDEQVLAKMRLILLEAMLREV